MGGWWLADWEQFSFRLCVLNGREEGCSLINVPNGIGLMITELSWFLMVDFPLWFMS